MQFISKNNEKYCIEGHRIIDSFIAGCWQDEDKKYINLEYNELKRRKDFNNLLLKEQRGFCCYCMREIPSNRLTLEHVMPKKIENDNKDEKSHYFQFISSAKVIYMTSINHEEIIKTPPYPHRIAYENLTASCDGRIYDGGEEYTLHGCCNNKRGNDKIIPLFFLPRIHYILKYEEDGRLLYTDEYEKTIKSLNLDCDSLRSIRKIWARIRKYNFKIKDIKAAESDIELRKDIIVRLDIDRSEEKKILHDLYWKLLIEYYWFYHYFNLKHL